MKDLTFDSVLYREPGSCLCGEKGEAARIGEVGLQMWSPPLLRGPGSEPGIGRACRQAPLSRSWEHMKACHTSGTRPAVPSIWTLLDLCLDSFCLSCGITYQQRQTRALASPSVAHPRCLPIHKHHGAGDRKAAQGPADKAALGSPCSPP